MEKYHTSLTEAETALLAKIDLRSIHESHAEGHQAHNANKEPLLALLKSLSDRQAIPQERRNYWNDPRYNPGRIKASHRGLFERNGRRGSDIYTHSDFLAYLRYFLFGCDLPDGVISEFEKKVGDPQWVTSSDVVPICKHARELTRRFGLDRSEAPEEFFKLCLDMGLGLNRALAVRQSVRGVK